MRSAAAILLAKIKQAVWVFAVVQGCELDRFLTEFEFKSYLQVHVRVLRILFFEFGENDRVEKIFFRVQVRVRSPAVVPVSV